MNARRALAACIAAAILCLLYPQFTQSSTDADEYRVKAADLLNFAKFIDWPAKSFSDARAPFIICVIGQDPFKGTLDSLLGEKVDARTLEIDHYPSAKSLPGAQCQIAFISSSEKGQIQKVIEFFRGQSVLLVGDSKGFAQSGGTIEFQTEEDHIRFAINSDAAGRAELVLSSKLLAIAQIVHDDPHREELK